MSDLIPKFPTPGGEFLFYQTEDGRTRLQVRLDAETVWLSLNQLAELFQRDKSVISRHIGNVFDEGELVRKRVVANYATTAADGNELQLGNFPAVKATAFKQLRQYYEQLGFQRLGHSEFSAQATYQPSPSAKDLNLPDTFKIPVELLTAVGQCNGNK